MAEFTPRQRYDFKRDLEVLASKRGMHTELISLYVPASKQMGDVNSYLRNEFSQASNIKSKQTQKNVQGALESLMSRLRGLRQAPENGLALFVGAVTTGNNQQKMEAYVFEPPQPVTTFVYRCDSRFFLDPLSNLLTEREVFGLLLVDRRECTVGILRGRAIEMIWYGTSQVPGKHGRGGQSQRRFERLTEEVANQWFKKCGEKASDIFAQEPDLQGILLGGPGPTKRYFLDGNWMHHEIQGKILDTFDTGYTDEYGLSELVENASQAMHHLSLVKEKQLFQRFQRQLAKVNNSLASYGEAQVRKALAMGAVDVLLLSEGIRKERVVVGCPSCAHIVASQTVTREQADDDPAGKCPKCSTPLAHLERSDVVDELSELAESMGTSVELMSTDSEEGSTLMRAFGGVAAILRFAIHED